MANVIQKNEDGNWSIDGYLIGTDRAFIQHMMQVNEWTVEEVVDYIMNNVAAALNTKVTQPVELFSTCEYGTCFSYKECDIYVELGEGGGIEDTTVPNVDHHFCPVVLVKNFANQLKREEAGQISSIWTDHHEEPSTNVYLATGPNWEGARLITNTADLVATVNDSSVYSLVQLKLELSLL